MLKERYTQTFRALHAEDDLIDRTMDAAANRARPREKLRWQPAAVIVCALVALVIAFAQMVPPPKDTVASSNRKEAEDALAALPAPEPSDDLTITVSNVRMDDERTLSFDLVIRGDRVDKLSTFDIIPSAHLYCQATRLADQDEFAPDNERHFTISLEAVSDSYWRTFGPMLQMEISQYTSGNTRQQSAHAIYWDVLTEPFRYTGEPIIGLGAGIGITWFSFEPDGRLCIQLRQPEYLPDATWALIWLQKADGLSPTLYVSQIRESTRDGNVYRDCIFDITREALPDYQLITFTQFTGDTIRGSWPFTVDLTALFAQ